jgi:hypothetical protein
MQQASLKLKSYAHNVNIIDNDNLQKRILKIMLWSFGALGIFYILFLGNMVFNIIERKALEVKANQLSNDVSDLELNYLSASNKVDLNLAYSLGFKEVKTQFATRKYLGSISIAKNEI